MRTTLTFLMSVCLAGFVYAQAPNWQVDASQYNYSMVIVGLIKVEGIETVNPNDRVAAFISGEVRGTAKPIFEQQANRNIFYLIIYHNDDAGNIMFKYYDAANNRVSSAAQTEVFLVDGIKGDVNRPYVWADHTLRTEANILQYSFPSQLGSKVYDDSVVVRVDLGTKLTTVIADFKLSDGAGLYMNNQRQVSGTTQNNFSDPVVLTVRSEDEQTIKQYVLSIREERDEIPNVLFPNGSSQNSTWGISHLGTSEPVNISVFDPNGHVLFRTTDPQQEWDGRYNGKQVPEGIYFYAIQREDGSKYQGSIQIIY